ncbi:MAG: DUF2764 family protein [Verrucomicrobia bacterium]|nr:DUF2764 family protein [Verrucomicrobiota bacterium]MBS0645611.1 DUF2764 family protein [Verrucomicrobiota bacterium]
MKEYYFLASFLPVLQIGHVPNLGFNELQELMHVNLTSVDFEKTIQMRRHLDIENMRLLWMQQPLDPRGNLNRDALEQALVDFAWDFDTDFEPYLIDFLTSYATVERRLQHYPLLLSAFFHDQEEKQQGFLRQYFEFQRQWRLVLLGFRAKQLGRDLSFELQFEDPKDPVVAELLAQKDMKVYEPPFEYKELGPLFEQYQKEPLELHRALYAYQFNYLVEVWGGELFTVDRILNYMARLILVERWLELDMQKGISVIDKIEGNFS